MQGKDLVVSALWSVEQVSAYGNEWEQLFDASSFNPFTSHKWFASLIPCRWPIEPELRFIIR